MDQYNIVIHEKARLDILSVVNYILEDFQEPQIAQKCILTSKQKYRPYGNYRKDAVFYRMKYHVSMTLQRYKASI